MASQRKKYANPFNKYPYNVPVSFYFRVMFDGNDTESECAFQEVKGINVSLETAPTHEGGVNDYSHKLPIRTKYDNLELKRGFLHGSSLLTWVNNAVRNFIFEPKLVQVFLINELGNELVMWSFGNAYPVAVKISEFKSTDNSIVVETIELAYAYFERVDLPQIYNVT
ncbi:MAG: phage tail protein [Bacteroidota bacterium]